MAVASARGGEARYLVADLGKGAYQGVTQQGSEDDRRDDQHQIEVDDHRYGGGCRGLDVARTRDIRHIDYRHKVALLVEQRGVGRDEREVSDLLGSEVALGMEMRHRVVGFGIHPASYHILGEYLRFGGAYQHSAGIIYIDVGIGDPGHLLHLGEELRGAKLAEAHRVFAQGGERGLDRRYLLLHLPAVACASDRHRIGSYRRHHKGEGHHRGEGEEQHYPMAQGVLAKAEEPAAARPLGGQQKQDTEEYDKVRE